METFDDETRKLINDIHHAWKSNASLSQYAPLRDRIITHRDRLDIQINTLSTVVRLAARRSPACQVQGDLTWQNFFALAATLSTEKDGDEDGDGDGDGEVSISPKPQRARPRNWNEICRSRNLATLVALWSADVVQYYKWDQVGQGQMRIIRTCAVHFPNFEAGFVPRLNQVLLARHSAAILWGQGRTLIEARLQPSKDFEIEAIKSLTVDPELQSLWLTSQDGAIPLDSKGTLLKDIRPRHFRMYLLQVDRYGTFEPRSSPASYATNVNPLAPAVENIENCPSESVFGSAQSSLGDGKTPNSHSSTRSVATIDSTSVPSDPISPTDLTIADFSPLDPGLLNDQSPTVPGISPISVQDMDVTLWSTPDMSLPELAPSWTPPTALDLGCSAPLGITCEGTQTESDSFWAQVIDQFANSACSPGTASHLLHMDDPGTARDLHEANGLRKELSFVYPPVPKRPRLSVSEDSEAGDDYCNDGESIFRYHVNTFPSQDFAQSLSPLTNAIPTLMDPSRPLRLSSGSVEGTHVLSLEEQFHKKHLPSLTTYLERLTNMIKSSQASAQTQWLTVDTQWAKIWSSSEKLGSGRASCEEEADVLYYAAEDIVAQAKAGKQFHKPLVVKEIFRDSGMHTITHFLGLLQDVSAQPDPGLGGSSDEEPAFVRSARYASIALSNAKTYAGQIASCPRNMTKSHRPIFTMLPRFHILETLIQAHLPDTQGPIELSPFDLRTCTGFNTVSRSGAFSGAHAYTLYGKWTRNLEGTSYVMIVPETEMISEWEAFVKQGHKWLPRGRERLIVLEKDDVLLIPPGSRIVHAIHSASDCLTEGGILWDSLNVINILNSILWACENNFTTQEPLFKNLPAILKQLQRLVSTQPEKFRGNMDISSFLHRIESVTEALKHTLASHVKPAISRSVPGQTHTL